MSFLSFIFLSGVVAGMVLVASNPSPYFGALGLVVSAAMGCGLLAQYGAPFLSLILFLIYLGGMLVVFAYTAALAAEAHPEGWGSRKVFVYVVGYLIGLCLFLAALMEDLSTLSWVSFSGAEDMPTFCWDMVGVAMLYSWGGEYLVLCGYVLLLTLIVVLRVTRGLSRGALRAIE